MKLGVGPPVVGILHVLPCLLLLFEWRSDIIIIII